MRTTLLMLALACWNMAAAQDASKNFSTEIAKARYLIEAHQKMTNTPGVQVAVMVNGTTVWSEGFGFSDIKNGRRVTPNTRFRIASVSKPVTSLVLGRMMETGRTDIDQDIRAYVPEFPEPTHPITARQLAASVSGVRHYNDGDPAHSSAHYDSVIDALEVFKRDPLSFAPGTAYQYSSYGWVLLSAAMERAANQSFFKLMEDSWQEMGMTSPSFDYPDFESPEASRFYVLARGNAREEAPVENRSYMYAGGGYLSTAEDLVRMGNQLIEDKFVSADTRRVLTSSHKLANGNSTNYGLGWETGKSRLGVPVIFHGGSMRSARSHLVIYPEQNIVFAYLSNTGDQVFFNDREAHSIAEICVIPMLEDYAQPREASLTGKWAISTTSLRDRRSSGTRELNEDENGLSSGRLSFKRSNKKGTYPAVVVHAIGSQAHIIAVSPMFIDLRVRLAEKTLSGTWLHDFNVNGVPEPDVYWRPRAIEGKNLE